MTEDNDRSPSPPCDDGVMDDDDEIDALMAEFDEAQLLTGAIVKNNNIEVNDRSPQPPCEDRLTEDDEMDAMMAAFDKAKEVTRQIPGRPKWNSLLELQHRKRSEIALLNEITVCFADKKNEAIMLGKTVDSNVLQNIIGEYKHKRKLPDVLI